MTREQEIKQAIKNNLDVSNYSPQDGEMLKETFYIGAKWADEHPKSPWISVNENLPPVEKYDMSIMVLALNTEGKINFSKYDYDAEEWISPVLDIVFTHWMPIPKLP